MVVVLRYGLVPRLGYREGWGLPCGGMIRGVKEGWKEME